jgi:hypothetical protein
MTGLAYLDDLLLSHAEAADQLVQVEAYLQSVEEFSPLGKHFLPVYELNTAGNLLTLGLPRKIFSATVRVSTSLSSW